MTPQEIRLTILKLYADAVPLFNHAPSDIVRHVSQLAAWVETGGPAEDARLAEIRKIVG